MGLEDYTKISIALDPFRQVMEGRTNHGNMKFCVPFITHVQDNLYMGGCTSGLVLPKVIENLVSLYPWERYNIIKPINSELYIKAHDAAVEEVEASLSEYATWIRKRMSEGPTLVHCQAGLNRSGLLVALVLIQDGMEPAEAIALLRGKRSPAVLCNKSYESWLLSQRKGKD